MKDKAMKAREGKANEKVREELIRTIKEYDKLPFEEKYKRLINNKDLGYEYPEFPSIESIISKSTKSEQKDLEALKIAFQMTEWDDFLLVLNEIRDRDKSIIKMYRKKYRELLPNQETKEILSADELDKWIKTIRINKANLEWISETGEINGSLLVELRRVIPLINESYYQSKLKDTQKQLLKDMASKIKSYMYSYSKEQTGYEDGKRLLERYDEFKTKDQ